MNRSQQELFDDHSLTGRLIELGLRGMRHVEVHENRSVMVSVTPTRVLRVHRGFAYAPDRVLSAIVTFVASGIRRDTRRRAEKTIVGFPVHGFVAPPPRRRRRRRSTPPVDRALVRELEQRHRTFNDRFFDGVLQRIRFRVSRRMERRLGEVQLHPETDRPVEIAISHAHLVRDGWTEVDQTLLHEMIHQWQAESGRPVDHGPGFRQKARVVGIVPRATRHIRSSRR